MRKQNDEKKPGTLTFLDAKEQEKVQKILSAYQEKTMADNGTQTEHLEALSTLQACKCEKAVVGRTGEVRAKCQPNFVIT